VYGGTNSTFGYGVEGSSPNYVGVYGTGEFGVLGTTNSTTAASVVGVLGETNSTNNAAGVQGNANAATGNSQGVFGLAYSPAGYGLQGVNTATTGNAVGVQGMTSSSTGYGVQGAASSPSAFGVFGSNAASTGTAPGVYGTSASPAGFGVEGSVSSPSGYGVYGLNYVTTGTTAGVYGTTASPTGYGVEGANAAPTGNAPGVYGTTASATGYGVEGAGPVGVAGEDTSGGRGTGVYGTSPGGTGVYGSGATGIFGVSTAGYDGVIGQVYGQSVAGEELFTLNGVWGDAGGPAGGFIGVLATADSNTALLALNNDSTGGFPTMEVENLTAAANTHFPVFQTSSPNTYSNSRHCTIDTSANLTCTGVVSGVIQADNGKETAVYAMQSAENWLEDAGSGQLSSGSARIELDSAFAQTVNAGVEYHVFLTPKGDCKGLYVTNESPTGFGVRELSGGTSSIAFDYRIMAKRKGYENVRLEDLTDRFKQPEAPRQKMRRPLPPAEMKSIPPRIATPPVMPLVAPRPIAPTPVLPKAVPLPHPAALAGKPGITQK